jgi:hypothetical protein
MTRDVRARFSGRDGVREQPKVALSVAVVIPKDSNNNNNNNNNEAKGSEC